jgi:hypothetical protein
MSELLDFRVKVEQEGAGFVVTAGRYRDDKPEFENMKVFNSRRAAFEFAVDTMLGVVVACKRTERC